MAHKQDKNHHDPLLRTVPQTCNIVPNLPSPSSKEMSTITQDEKDNRGNYITLWAATCILNGKKCMKGIFCSLF